MARRPAQYGTAKVKERDAARPLLVILLLVAAGLAVFLWLQPDNSTTTVVAPPEEPVAEAEAEPEPAQAEESGVEDWWSRVEGSIYDAFRAGEDGDCDGLRWAVEDLSARDTRSEPALVAAYQGLVGTLERAAEACESRPGTLPGTMSSASRRLDSLLAAGRAHGVEASAFLEEYL